jgi:hypothetical protein
MKVQVVELPEKSVAVKVTVVLAFIVVPAVGLCVTVGLASQLSLAVAKPV